MVSGGRVFCVVEFCGNARVWVFRSESLDTGDGGNAPGGRCVW